MSIAQSVYSLPETVNRPQNDIAVQIYTTRRPEAVALFQADVVKMADRGFRPASECWIPGDWGTVAFVVALLLCLIIIGVVALVYMLIIKPPGSLIVIFERRTFSAA